MKKVKILIVEDEILVAETIKRSLQRRGYEVTGIAVTGEEAIDLAERDTPDIAIMDITLKGAMNGIATAGHIHGRYGISIIFLTAHTNANIYERAKITKPFIYITKPFEERQLITVIESMLTEDGTETPPAEE